jgi:hypothetical protein
MKRHLLIPIIEAQPVVLRWEKTTSAPIVD